MRNLAIAETALVGTGGIAWFASGADASIVLVVVALGAIAIGSVALALVAHRASEVERAAATTGRLDAIVDRFLDRRRALGELEPAIRMLELDLRDELGVAHVWIDVARDERSRRGAPGAVVIPAAWEGEQLARLTIAPPRGHALDGDTVTTLERLATFLGAAIGMDDAGRRRDEADDRIAQADQLKDRFLALAGHELRTPLTSIRGFSDTITRQWDILPDEDKRRFLAIVVAQSERLAQLVEDLLLLSGVQSGRFDLRSVQVPLGQVVRRVVDELDARPDVAISCDPDAVALADADHVERMLRNYLENALAFGAGPVAIACSVVRGDVLVEVTDAGPGVSEQFRPFLFTEFQRHRTSLGVPGTGLGLPIVRTLAHAYGGDAWFEPVEPHGAKFVLRLPAAPTT